MFFNEAQLLAAENILRETWRIPHSTYLPCEWRASLSEPIDAVHTVRAHETQRYTLGILQAQEKAVEDISGQVAFVNANGEELSVSQRHWASAILFAAWLFVLTAAYLFVLCVLRRRGRSRLHAVMLMTLFMKCMTLLLMRQDISQIATTGTTIVGRQVLWQLSRQVEVIMEVVLFYIIGLGWK